MGLAVTAFSSEDEETYYRDIVERFYFCITERTLGVRSYNRYFFWDTIYADI